MKAAIARQLFSNTWFYITTGLIIVQQLIVASSSLFIVELSARLSTKQSYLAVLCLYLASLILPYFPGVLSLVTVVKWRESLIRTLSEFFISNYRSRPDLFPNKQLKNVKSGHLSVEVPDSTNDFCNFTADLISVALNVLLNVLAVAAVVEIRYLYSFAASGVLVASILWWQSKIQSRYAEATQDSRVALADLQRCAWDNVTLGNGFHFSGWYAELRRRLERRESLHVKEEGFRQGISLVVSLLTFLPSLLVAAHAISEHRSNSAAVLAVVVTLPRLFMILNNLHALLTMLAVCPAKKVRMKGLFSAFSAVEDQKLSNRYHFDRLVVTDEAQRRITESELMTKLQRPEKVGRITIRGSNGAGKSSLLLNLKKILGEDMCLVPAQHELFQKEGHSGSTGQRTIEQINQIIAQDRSPILMLDEWDANLDMVNAELISARLAEISRTRCVVEVRHGREQVPGEIKNTQRFSGI